MPPPFDRSVFINCPFDDEYAPILQSIAFCTVYMGFFPRLAPENADNAAARLDRIIDLVKGSKYAIHDLSRCKSAAAGEYARLNMPFELGIDHGCRKFGRGELRDKVILIFEQTRFDYQKALSDISGWDIRVHDGSFETASREVRSWLIAKAGAEQVGASRIQGEYATFQEWYWEKQLDAGSSQDDIKKYPTSEFISAMYEWMAEED